MNLRHLLMYQKYLWIDGSAVSVMAVLIGQGTFILKEVHAGLDLCSDTQ